MKGEDQLPFSSSISMIFMHLFLAHSRSDAGVLRASDAASHMI